MLTDKQVRDRFRFNIFQSWIYSPDAVESSMGEYIASYGELDSARLIGTREEVNAVAHVSQEEPASPGPRPCKGWQL